MMRQQLSRSKTNNRDCDGGAAPVTQAAPATAAAKKIFGVLGCINSE